MTKTCFSCLVTTKKNYNLVQKFKNTIEEKLKGFSFLLFVKNPSVNIKFCLRKLFQKIYSIFILINYFS